MFIVNLSGTFEKGYMSGRSYFLYEPSHLEEGKTYPLVVMLHGCNQSAEEFARATKMNEVAEEEAFFVLYPEQSQWANPRKCWNWFETYHQKRKRGEPMMIANMVRGVERLYPVDSSRIYVAGLSAGGAMSVIMGATYPDLFAAVGVSAGLEYGAATNILESVQAMERGGPSAKVQGVKAYEAMKEYARPVPLMVFHGDEDKRVHVVNSDQIIIQWCRMNNLAALHENEGWIDDETDYISTHTSLRGRSYTRYVYKNKNDVSWLEKVIVHKMGHCWAGGSGSEKYTDSSGPNASKMLWNFLKQWKIPSNSVNE
ncbi:extracellular catalytic domain type 1 short-chain-length polyhydroxyalkanoate depolymerase [Priestia koreensis]|uniref:Uncharacterized protein n=1 Tax=Priestia koreensis TaxID=284581 RepID=A0A0M0KVK6_9BACI|nr:PHB depolymerase family esterase [Priestia koreensis]KOO42849.1 hypothetical protein AMD01_17055 [Priestia koreensis]